MSKSVSITERDAAVEKFYPRIEQIAKERLSKIPKLKGDLRRLTRMDFESAGAKGLLRAANNMGSELTQAYANVSIRNAIIDFQRIAIRQKEAVSIATTGEDVEATWSCHPTETKDESLHFQRWQFDNSLNVEMKPTAVCASEVLGGDLANTYFNSSPSTDSKDTTRSQPGSDLNLLEIVAEQGLKKIKNPLWRKLLQLRSILNKSGKPLSWEKTAKKVHLRKEDAQAAHREALVFLHERANGLSPVQAISPKSVAGRSAREQYISICEDEMLRQRTKQYPNNAVVHTSSGLSVTFISENDPVWHQPSRPCLSSEAFEELVGKDKPTVRGAEPCLFKGQGYFHPEFGPGIVKADWTLWNKGVDVQFSDGSIRNIESKNYLRIQNFKASWSPFRAGRSPNECEGKPTFDGSWRCPKYSKKTHGPTGVNLKNYPDWNASPFLKGGPSSSYAAYVNGINAPQPDDLLPTVAHSKTHSISNHKDVFELHIGPEASPTRSHTNPANYQHGSPSGDRPSNRFTSPAVVVYRKEAQ